MGGLSSSHRVVSDLTTLGLASLRVNDLRDQGRSCDVLYDLASGVIHTPSLSPFLWLTQASPIQCERGLPKGISTRRGGSLWAALESDYPRVLCACFSECTVHFFGL